MDKTSLAWIGRYGGPIESFQSSGTGIGIMQGWNVYPWPGDTPEGAEISKHVARDDGSLLMLSIRPVCSQHILERGDRVAWYSTLKLVAGRYVRGYGYCPDFPSALDAVNRYQHHCTVSAGRTWWHQTGGSWVSWDDDIDLEIVPMKTARHEDRERWALRMYGTAASFEDAAGLADAVMRHTRGGDA